jgi:hypothetical protein
LSVNYDRIFTTGIGAIQELAKRVENLRADESRLAQLEEKAARVDALEKDIADLKKLVTQLAQSQNGGKATAAIESQEPAAAIAGALRDVPARSTPEPLVHASR